MEHLRLRKIPYSLNCHEVATGMYCCALENIVQILVAHRMESVIATGHELSVEVSFTEPVRNRRNFFVHIALSCSM